MAMNLRLSPEETARLREAARRRHISMQQAARQAIEEWLERSRGLSTAEVLALSFEPVPRADVRAALAAADAEWEPDARA